MDLSGDQPSLKWRRHHFQCQTHRFQYKKAAYRRWEQRQEDRLQRVNTEIPSRSTGMVSGKPKLSWGSDLHKVSKTTKASITALAVKGWTRKMCVCGWMGQVIYWWWAWVRLRDSQTYRQGSGSRTTSHEWTRIKSQTSPWDPPPCMHRCWDSWLMSLQHPSLLCLKGAGNHGRSLMTRRQQMVHSSSDKSKRGWSGALQTTSQPPFGP